MLSSFTGYDQAWQGQLGVLVAAPFLSMAVLLTLPGIVSLLKTTTTTKKNTILPQSVPIPLYVGWGMGVVNVKSSDFLFLFFTVIC